MADRGLLEIGQRMRELRRWRGMSQEDLVAASGVPIAVIKKLEQGRGGARMENYHAIARALDVETMIFVPRSLGAPDYAEDNDARSIILAGMRDVIAPPLGLRGSLYPAPLDGEAPNLERLKSAVNALCSAYDKNRYDFVGQVLPGLLHSAHFHVEAAPSSQDAIRVRWNLLSQAARYLTQIREHDLALFAIRDAIEDAKRVGDQAMMASTIGRQARIMIRQARLDAAERLCTATADELEPKISNATTEELASWGRTLLWASAAAARNNRPEVAGSYLSAAASAATRLQVEQHGLTGNASFGPLTVAVKGPENELLAGRASHALDLAGRLPDGVGRMTPSGWQQHLLYCAHALVLTDKHDKATELMTSLRLKAPEWLRHQRLARNVTRSLLKSRKRMPSKEQRTLADFLKMGPLDLEGASDDALL